MTTRTVHRTCPLCEATCGLAITMDGDDVTVIRGDRENPFSKGFICPKGTTLGRLHADPDRVRTPLIRRDGELVEATWEEAYAEIDRRYRALVDAHGRQSAAVYVGNPNAHGFHNALVVRSFAKALGTPNIFTASTVDQMPRHVSAGHMFGHAASIPVPDIDRTDHLLMLGANPLESNGSLATAPDWPGRLEALRERGGRLVVVDPRRTKTAAIADRHVAIRPGTDAAWLLSLAHVIVEEDLVAAELVPSEGLDRAIEAVAAFSPEAVARFTGVDADVTRTVARELATAPTACVYGRIGTHTVAFGTLASWAADLLNVITGNLDRPGGAMFPLALHQPARRRQRPFRQGRFASRVRGLPETIGELPVATLADEILTPGEGQVRALFTIAGNPALTCPDSARLDRALDDLDLLVCVDIYVNETTRHADVILPGRSALETSHYDLAFTALSVRDYAMYSPQIHEHDGPSEFDTIVSLAAIVGGAGPDADPRVLAEATLMSRVHAAVTDPDSSINGRDPDDILRELSRWPIPERFLDLMIRTGARGDAFGAVPDGMTLEILAAAPHGIDFGPLRPRLADAVSRPGGLVDLAPAPFIEDVPRLLAAMGNSPASMVLVGRRELRSNNSWLHNVEVLVRGAERCTLQINREDADSLGVDDGDPVSVESAAGCIVAPAQISDDIMPGVVSLPYGWGHGADGVRLSVASDRPGVNTNILTDASPLDPLSGNAVLNGIPVELAAAGTGV